MKKSTFWFKLASYAMLVTAGLHMLGHFATAEPANETEETLLELMTTLTPGSFSRSASRTSSTRRSSPSGSFCFVLSCRYCWVLGGTGAQIEPDDPAYAEARQGGEGLDDLAGLGPGDEADKSQEREGSGDAKVSRCDGQHRPNGTRLIHRTPLLVVMRLRWCAVLEDRAESPSNDTQCAAGNSEKV